MEYSRDPILLRTMEFEKAANNMGLKRLIAEYLSIWKYDMKQLQLQHVCTIPEVQGNSDNLYKAEPKNNFSLFGIFRLFTGRLIKHGTSDRS